MGGEAVKALVLKRAHLPLAGRSDRVAIRVGVLSAAPPLTRKSAALRAPKGEVRMDGELRCCQNTTNVLLWGNEALSKSPYVPAGHHPHRPRAQTAPEGGRGYPKNDAQFHCRTGAKPRKSQGGWRADGQSQRLEARQSLRLGVGRPPGRLGGASQAAAPRPHREPADECGSRALGFYAAAQRHQTHARGLCRDAKVRP